MAAWPTLDVSFDSHSSCLIYSFIWFFVFCQENKVSLLVIASTSSAKLLSVTYTNKTVHNLFLDDEKLWLFDLGEPAIQPVAAFLTKYLMSFFHTLGMEDIDVVTTSGAEAEVEAVSGMWVRRFMVQENQLHLTKDTADIVPKIYEAFEYTVDRMIQELFDGEEAVRDLLIRYVVLQILSDCAFCVDRWTSKGGGCKSVGNHHHNLENWLWRAIWDFWIASDVAAKLLKEGSWA